MLYNYLYPPNCERLPINMKLYFYCNLNGSMHVASEDTLVTPLTFKETPNVLLLELQVQLQSGQQTKFSIWCNERSLALKLPKRRI